MLCNNHDNQAYVLHHHRQTVISRQLCITPDSAGYPQQRICMMPSCKGGMGQGMARWIIYAQAGALCEVQTGLSQLRHFN